jgi:hypothetical protein
MRDTNRGLFGLVVAIIGSAVCISLVTASVSHLPIVILGIGAGLWAVELASRSGTVCPDRFLPHSRHQQET